MVPQLRTLTLILISYASFHFLLDNLTPPAALAQPAPRPPSVLDKIPLDKWSAAIDKLYGKVEDWRPMGIESIRMVRITTTTRGPTKASTVSTTTTTTTTAKPTSTTTTAKPTTTTSRPTTTTTTTKPSTTTTTKPTTTTTTKPTTTTTTTKPTTTTTTKPTTTTTTTKPTTTTTTSKPTTTTKATTTTTATPYEQITTTNITDFAVQVIHEIEERSKFKPNTEEIINGLATGGLKRSPPFTWGPTFQPLQPVPYEDVETQPTMDGSAIVSPLEGHFINILLDYNRRRCYFLASIWLRGDKSLKGVEWYGDYDKPDKNSKNIFMFLAFKRPSDERLPEYSREGFDIFNFIKAENVTLIDATAFSIIQQE